MLICHRGPECFDLFDRSVLDDERRWEGTSLYFLPTVLIFSRVSHAFFAWPNVTLYFPQNVSSAFEIFNGSATSC